MSDEARSGPGTGAVSAATRHTPQFLGEGREYFRIWIVNLALTILTLGIYSAWAKVRKLRYFHGKTVLAGSAFGYHASPLAILKGRLLAVLLGLIYFGATQFSPVATIVIVVLLALAMPWLLVKSRAFAMRMTSWRGVRFTFREDYRGAYAVMLGWGLAAAATLGLLLPVFMRERFRYVVTRTGFGDQPFDCDPRLGRFYKTAVVAVGLTLALFAVLMLLAMGAAGIAAATGALDRDAPPGAGLSVLSLAGGMLFYVLLFSVVGGYAQSRNLNEVFGTTSIGPHKLHSSLRARALAWIYLTNIAGILVTLGLYAPWAQIRLARYRLGAIELEANGSLDEFAASAATAPAATGEEIAELFDVDFGF